MKQVEDQANRDEGSEQPEEGNILSTNYVVFGPNFAPVAPVTGGQLITTSVSSTGELKIVINIGRIFQLSGFIEALEKTGDARLTMSIGDGGTEDDLITFDEDEELAPLEELLLEMGLDQGAINTLKVNLKGGLFEVRVRNTAEIIERIRSFVFDENPEDWE